MNSCIVKDDKLFVYVHPSRIPATEFAQKRLREYCQDTFNGDMVSTIKTIIKDKEFCLVFTPSDYIAFTDILDEYLDYDLYQARMIIKWIDCCVRNPDDESTDRDDATVDWAAVYLEILESANGE